MSGFDILIAVVFLVSILVGVIRGFIKEALSIASWIMAIWLGLSYCTEAGEFIGRYVQIPAEGFRTGAGFALVFIGTLFLFSLLSFVISKLLVQGPIKGTDRVLGIGFGAARAVAILVAVMLVARGMGMENSDWWQDSKYLGYLEPVANFVEQRLPESLQSSNEEGSGAPAAEEVEGQSVDAAEETEQT